MKLVIIEPLGVNDEKLLSMAKDMLPADLEIVYYNTRVTDTETLIERAMMRTSSPYPIFP